MEQDVIKDIVYPYMRANIVASSGNENVFSFRDALEKEMTSNDIFAAQ